MRWAISVKHPVTSNLVWLALPESGWRIFDDAPGPDMTTWATREEATAYLVGEEMRGVEWPGEVNIVEMPDPPVDKV